MRTITCTSLGSVTAITIGSTYEIIAESGSRYTIINDKGVQSNYGKNLFSAPVNVPDAPIAEEPANNAVAAPRRGRPARAAQAEAAGLPVPEAIRPAPRLVESIDIITSATNDDGSISFSISFDFGGGFQFTYSTGSIIESTGISASCGIQSISGIDSLAFNVRSSRVAFTAYIAQHSNDFTLNGELDQNEIFSEISKALLQDLVSSFQGDDADVKAGLLIISTTEGNIAETPELRSALDIISANSSSVHNPNSGNQIVTWSIPVEA